MTIFTDSGHALDTVETAEWVTPMVLTSISTHFVKPPYDQTNNGCPYWPKKS
jgi:hypothetical protein